MTVIGEPARIVGWLLKLVLVLVACLVTALLAAGPGVAGTYTVHQCDDTQGNGHHSFQFQNSGTPSFNLYEGSACNDFGLGVRNTIGARTFPNSGYGGWFAYAPSGTVITSFSGYFRNIVGCCLEAAAPYGAAFVGAARSYLFQGYLPHVSGAGWGAWTGRGWSAASAGWGGATSVGFYIRCGQPDYAAWTQGCGQNSGGDLRLSGRIFDFTLRDDVAPSAAVGGNLLAGGWLRGTKTLDFWSGDTGGGVTGVSARTDNGTTFSAGAPCTVVAGRYATLQPCPLGHGGSWGVNTAQLPDGQRSITVTATDVGGATGQVVRTFSVDNNAPAAPMGLSVAGGEGWRSSKAFSVSWANPGGQHAPISAVHFELCPVVPAGSCVTGSKAGSGIDALTGSVPARGEYRLRTWLEDAAGNVNAAAKSAPVMLRFDDQPPGRAEPAATAGWLNGADAKGFQQSVALASGETRPLSGIAGYSATINGTDPDGRIEVAGDPAVHTFVDLPEGTTTIKTRAVSGSGVASDSVGSTVLRVDKTAPSASISGAPDPAAWSRTPVSMHLTGTDQPQLSGMPAAPVGAPVEQGGYLVHRLNGGAVQRIRGASGSVTIAGDGRHTFEYMAIDAAGNPSVVKTAQFKIDRTAPSGSFDYQDPGDPRRLSVSVFDATSGVAAGQIEYRREGAGEFKPLPTTLRGGKLTAQLDDVSLPDGRYEFRARTRDVAGNQSSIDRRADGRAMVLNLPLRITTKTTVVTGGGVKLSDCAIKASKKKTRKKRRKAMRKCKKRKVIVRSGRNSVSLRYGKRARTVGQVTTTAGIPVPHAYMTVQAQLRSGGPFTRIGATRTDSQGIFRHMVGPGPSRTIRFHYEGTNTIRPSIGQLTTKVQGALTLGVNRGRARNGQKVVFRGRLRGKPFPTGGKLIVLKAKVPGVARWRTFGTTRTNAKGRYRYPRRFTNTQGLVRYTFRAEAPREITYSYEKGLSKTKQVIVKGPGG